MAGMKAALDGQAPAAQSGRDVEEDKKRFVGAGMQMLYDNKFVVKAEQMLKDGQNTIEDMANIGSSIAMKIFNSAQKQGVEIDVQAILLGGEQLMREIGEFANDVGAEVSDEDIETAYFSAADKLRTKMINQGLVKPEELEAQARQITNVNGDDIKAAAQRVDKNRKATPGKKAPEGPAKKGMAQ